MFKSVYGVFRGGLMLFRGVYGVFKGGYGCLEVFMECLEVFIECLEGVRCILFWTLFFEDFSSRLNTHKKRGL